MIAEFGLCKYLCFTDAQIFYLTKPSTMGTLNLPAFFILMSNIEYLIFFFKRFEILVNIVNYVDVFFPELYCFIAFTIGRNR